MTEATGSRTHASAETGAPSRTGYDAVLANEAIARVAAPLRVVASRRDELIVARRAHLLGRPGPRGAARPTMTETRPGSLTRPAYEALVALEAR